MSLYKGRWIKRFLCSTKNKNNKENSKEVNNSISEDSKNEQKDNCNAIQYA